MEKDQYVTKGRFIKVSWFLGIMLAVVGVIFLYQGHHHPIISGLLTGIGYAGIFSSIGYLYVRTRRQVFGWVLALGNIVFIVIVNFWDYQFAGSAYLGSGVVIVGLWLLVWFGLDERSETAGSRSI